MAMRRNIIAGLIVLLTTGVMLLWHNGQMSQSDSIKERPKSADVALTVAESESLLSKAEALYSQSLDRGVRFTNGGYAFCAKRIGGVICLWGEMAKGMKFLQNRDGRFFIYDRIAYRLDFVGTLVNVVGDALINPKLTQRHEKATLRCTGMNSERTAYLLEINTPRAVIMERAQLLAAAPLKSTMGVRPSLELLLKQMPVKQVFTVTPTGALLKIDQYNSDGQFLAGQSIAISSDGRSLLVTDKMFELSKELEIVPVATLESCVSSLRAAIGRAEESTAGK